MAQRRRIAGPLGPWVSVVCLLLPSSLAYGQDTHDTEVEASPAPYPTRIVERPLVLPQGIVRASATVQRFQVAGHEEPFLASSAALTVGLGSRLQLRFASSYQWQPSARWPGFIRPSVGISLFDGDDLDVALALGSTIDARPGEEELRVPLAALDLPVRWRWRKDLACQSGNGLAVHSRTIESTRIRLSVFCTFSTPTKEGILPISVIAGMDVKDIVIDSSGVELQDSSGDRFLEAVYHPVWWLDVSFFLGVRQYGASFSVRSLAF